MLSEHLWRLGVAEEAVFLTLRGRQLSPSLPLDTSPRRVVRVYRPPRPERWHPFWDWLFLEGDLRRLGLRLFHSPRLCAFRPRCCPLIVSVLDLILLRYPQRYLVKSDVRWLYRRMLGVARQAEMVITISDWSRKDIEELLGIPRGRIRVTYPGVADGFFQAPSPERRAKLLARLNLQGPYILNVGGFDYRKNLFCLVEAYYSLGEFRRPFRLVLAGRAYGPEVATLRALIERRALAEEVAFTGPLSAEELRDLYSGATMFVYPSLYEGFGLPVLEAMAAGVPTVVSNRSSLPEVAGEAALLVDPEDPDALAHAIRRVLEDSGLRETLQRDGPEQARKFSWKRTAEQTWQIYRELAGE